MIYAKMLKDSMNPANGVRLCTMEVEYPLYIHNEIMTHRAFSRNSASSRAIPVEKRLQRVLDDPVIPTVWPKNQPGMSADINIVGPEAEELTKAWCGRAVIAVDSACYIAERGVHKQIANRIVEPWCWMKTIISATDWENFFSLRCAKDAHPDLQELAFWMLDAMMKSVPNTLRIGEWHIPFEDRINEQQLVETTMSGEPNDVLKAKIKVSVARCARISYLTQDGVIDLAKDVYMHDERLLPSRHMSPFEHQAQCVEDSRYFGNFRGWLQYRKTIEGECRTVNLSELYLSLKRDRLQLGKKVDVIA